MRTIHWLRRLLAIATVMVAATAGASPATPASTPAPEFWLTIIHNNDGESKLLEQTVGTGRYGGVARFKTVVDVLEIAGQLGYDPFACLTNRYGELERLARTPGSPLSRATCFPSRGVPAGARGVITLSSGDNFLAGAEFNASLKKGVPFYDSIAMSLVGYDAVAIGNHEFDFGPDVLVDFIRGFDPPVPFLSANLGFAGEPSLQALVAAGRIAKSTIVVENGERIGVVGATTPLLPAISSPRNVTVDPNVAAAVQAEIDALEAAGVNKIVLISHLQNIDEDLALAPTLSGVDVMIAGGGDELLANAGDELVPGDTVFGPYPLVVKSADGVDVPVVTTAGDYKYVGRLIVGFDADGKVVTVDPRSGPVRVSAQGLDAVPANRQLQAAVVEPIAAAVAELAANVIGTSEVPLDGRRSPGIRTQETNLGSLLADALLWQANKLAPAFGVPVAEIALQNGGGIRNNNVIPPGPITELHTFQIAAFANFVSIVPGISASQLKEILENAVSEMPDADGRFAQVAGFKFTYDLAGTPQVVDDAGTVLTPGSRVKEVELADGTKLVTGGSVVAGAPTVDIATIDFSARGGDQYPFRGAPFTTLGVTYQQALRNYIQQPDGLNGVIRASQYPEGGTGRITRIG